MNKNILIPTLIIISALFIGGVVLFSNKNKQTVSTAPQQNLRVLKVSIQGMTCAGCAASIENYVKAMPGVTNVSVTLATKSGIFIYDSSKVTKEEIVKNIIFDIYPPTIVSDEVYDSSTQQFTQSQTPRTIRR